MAQTVGELGESGVLQRVLSRLSVADAAVLGPGDDCAVLSVRGELVVTTDTMIEGPDFRAAWHGGFELGWKLAATNLSDVAAMGARPTALTLALAVPRDTPVSLLEQIAEGMTAACRTLAPGCGVVGGDLGTAPVITAAVTALGELADRPAVTRSGARAGDRIAYAGELGLAGMGLSLLFAAAADEDGIADPAPMAELWETQPEILSAQLAPTPPIPLGIAAAAAGASAMMDVSDSLSIDAHRMARASEVRLDLSSARLSEAFGVQQGVAVPIEAMLSGGEDHGLLATFPPTAELPHGFSVIGEVSPAALPGHGDSSGLLLDGAPVAPSGWDPYVVRWPGA
ncbi:thiamine-phosphate kinase [Leucobacter chromiireducens]|uniref:Thiamine-monophosphate kinase n=1 Tax=Leucobacter chromiireducens subsp. chromiireducens TaxID=660067 RepID=A0ABS1SUL4_9MICO|nr:thiamine-phosphate kinase [Leucobacter chromiireducens]MBL3690872.1 thiamine-phosphate kinase [Leucobacter chromiireducens subsp. chromiireducens]